MPDNAASGSNYEIFRECISEPVLRRLATPAEKPKKRREKTNNKSKKYLEGRKSRDFNVSEETAGDVLRRRLENGSWADSEQDKKDIVATAQEPAKPYGDPGDDIEELSEFVDYLAAGIFADLPNELRKLSYHELQDSPSLQSKYALPLSSDTITSLTASLAIQYAEDLSTYLPSTSTPDPTYLETFLTPVLNAYIETVTTPPPPPSSTKAQANGCEICLREYIPLTYHHLIPKSTHEKVIRRGWHEEWKLNGVAWLCRQCHSFVHRIASNEELAREWYTVERLAEREDVRKWAVWCGGVRWKKR